MLPILFAVLISLAEASFYEDHFKEIQAELSKKNEGNDKQGWQFGLNDYFAGKHLTEIKCLMGTQLEEEEVSNTVPKMSPEEVALHRQNIKLPKSFDARKEWKECTEIISRIKDQSTCGSCWAVSAASVMSDRTCINSKGSVKVHLSDEDILSCCRDCGYGCQGGFPTRAFKYWNDKGVPTGADYGNTTTCKPYTIKPCHGAFCTEAKTPKCTKQCINEYNKTLEEDRHYASTWFKFWFGENSMMKDIFLNGPIVAAFSVYSDFLYYKSGVYEHKIGTFLGGHAVRIVGWGEEDNKKYWLVANSWTNNFGEDGLFKIKRGAYECGIEGYATAGYAKM